MPLTFLQAKARVSPDDPVQPGSKEHMEIMALMRQSGHLFAEDNVIPLPGRAKELDDFKPYRERIMPNVVPMAVSKKEFLSLPSNKKALDEHLALHATTPIGSLESPPQYLSWIGKTAPKMERPMSKREWAALLK
jgi:hypothetical protein